MKQYFKYITWIPPIIIMIAIFCFSSQPAEESSELSEGLAGTIIDFVENISGEEFIESRRSELCDVLQTPVRKGAHMSEYAVLGIAVLIPIYLWNDRWKPKKYLIISIIVTIMYAMTDEFHQLFVPGRAGRITDVMIDGVGATMGIVLFYVIVLKKRGELWRRKGIIHQESLQRKQM